MKTRILLLCIAGLIFSCNHQPAKSNGGALEETSLRLSWIPSTSSAGDFIGKEKFAKGNGLNLHIDIGGPGIDPMKMIESGADVFGLAGSDLVLIANEKGADFVIIGLLNYNSPGVWLARKEKQIRTVADLKGKRIGEFTNSDMTYLYEVFLKRTGLRRYKDFTPVTIPYDLKNFIAKDECDLRPVFIYNEPADLDMIHLPYTLIEPKNLGIQFKGLCYFCKRETIEKNPALVQKFINTIISGWQEAVSHPDEAANTLKQNDGSINVEKEKVSMQIAKDYFSGYKGEVLNTDTDSWRAMTNDLKLIKALKSEPNLSKELDMKFVQAYYNKPQKKSN